MQLEGKVALVTGAGSGIARATALMMAREGAAVVAVGRSRPALDAVVQEIEAGGGRAIAAEADVGDSEAVRAAYFQADRAFGGLDVVFANAGTNGTAAPIQDLKPEEWDQVMATNLRGTFLTVKHAIPMLRARGGGSIVITSSVNGTRVFSTGGLSAYSASKAGQVAFAKVAALELAHHRIRVNAICPGAIGTSIEEGMPRRNLAEAVDPATAEHAVPLTGKPKGTSDQVARVVVFLASDAADHVTGTELWIDGAESLIGESWPKAVVSGGVSSGS